MHLDIVIHKKGKTERKMPASVSKFSIKSRKKLSKTFFVSQSITVANWVLRLSLI